jgi:hypothetical protein
MALRAHQSGGERDATLYGSRGVSAGLSASIHARLLASAKQRREEFQAVLTRYGLERFLYRLSQAPARETLWLKGALLFDVWFDVPHRPTRDADFLGFGPADTRSLEAAVREACAVQAEDGMSFDPDSIRIIEIREDASYGGLRVTLQGRLGKAICPVQLDVGYGDAVTPGAVEADYPTLLTDMPAPRLRVYPRETVFAEKLEAIVSFGMTNSRMKDYFDLRALAREGVIDPAVLSRAIPVTFERRKTPLPDELPMGLSDEFAADRTKLAQWAAFLKRNKLDAPALSVVVRELREFLEGPTRNARRR